MDVTIQKPVPSYTTRARNDTIWNILTFLVLLGTMCMVGAFAVIYLSPNWFFNPFPPVKLPEAAALPPATSTSAFPSTWTPTVTQEPAATNTPQPETPTETPYIAPTQPPLEVTPLPPAVEGNPTQPGSVYPFELRGQLASVMSTIIYPDKGCNWLGVGGQVFDLQGAPLVGASVLVGGKLAGKPVSLLTLTGTARQYGEAGYEVQLGNQPVASAGTLWLQLIDQAGLPLSGKVAFDTAEDCQKNLV
ncbi:MAG: hypothetical protein PHQ40_17225, partial [Anaerolineaceae bacterium]|nr:hypothetical protein [Anaerolineaceae bacterium]